MPHERLGPVNECWLPFVDQRQALSLLSSLDASRPSVEGGITTVEVPLGLAAIRERALAAGLPSGPTNPVLLFAVDVAAAAAALYQPRTRILLVEMPAAHTVLAMSRALDPAPADHQPFLLRIDMPAER